MLRLYYPGGVIGFSKADHPVLIVPFGRCDIKGVIEGGGKENFIKYTYQILEQAMFKMQSKSLATGKEVTQMIVIFDMAGLSLKHLTYKSTVDVLLSVVGDYEKNYPEVLHAAFAINAPKVNSKYTTTSYFFCTSVTLHQNQIFYTFKRVVNFFNF